MTQTTLQHYSVWVSEWKSRVSSWITMAALIDGNEYIGRRMLEWTSIVLFYAFCLSFRLSHGVCDWMAWGWAKRQSGLLYECWVDFIRDLCVWEACVDFVMGVKNVKNLEVFGLFLSNSDDAKFKN